MGLVKKASQLWQGARRHKKDSRGSKDDIEIGVKVAPKGKVAKFLAEKKLRLQKANRDTAEEESAEDKERTLMTRGVLSIHDLNDHMMEDSHKLRVIAKEQRIHIVEDDDEEDKTDESDEGESEDEVDESVIEDMRKLEENFKGISLKYRLLNRIGEGTFSTVYKAEQLPQSGDEYYEDALEHDCYPQDNDENNPPAKRRKLSSSSEPPVISNPIPRRKPQYVALKKIYVTSSPQRIQNELEILHALRSSPHVCPLLTAFRHLDQVVAVLPYFHHRDFRLYYREFLISDMRNYFHSLLSALASVHRAGIIHRDIKPTNFLYDRTRRRGVLVDFGLAEKQGTDWQPCLCLEPRDVRKDRYMSSLAFSTQQTTGTSLSTGYPKNDSRPSRRANRAGTRGFRAPEVLLKCTSQTTKIDIWSTGVILLTILARRFPFFNSTDDVDATIEIASIFGKRRMKVCAAMHGSVFETNVETIGERGFTLERIVVWASCRENPLGHAEMQAVRFLEGLLELDPARRLSAKEALAHEFFVAPVKDDDGGQGQRVGEEEQREEGTM